jgi:hypothetical protein
MIFTRSAAFFRFTGFAYFWQGFGFGGCKLLRVMV